LVNARKTRLNRVEQHPGSAWSWCFATHMPALFTFGYICCEISIRPVPTPWKFSWKAKSRFRNFAIWEDLLRKDRPYKNMPAVLVGGMCRWHVRSNTQQRQTQLFVPTFMPCIARRYLRLRTANIFIEPRFFVTFWSCKK
jgi:hypothetical protein